MRNKKYGLAVTAMCIALTAAPVTAQAAVVTIPMGNGILIGNTNQNCLEALKEKLEAAGLDWEKIFGNCITPEQPDIELPDNQAPDVQQPDNQEPDNQAPDIQQPDIQAPDIQKPENQLPDNQKPETEDNVKPEEDTENNTPSEDEDTEVNSTYAEQIVALVNVEREKAGLAPVTLSIELGQAAMIRAKEIEISFSHTRPNGSYFTSVLRENGITYRLAGENIAWGQKSPEEVMNAWMNSAGHRANILNANFKELGVAHYQNARGVNYFVQLFKQ